MTKEIFNALSNKENGRAAVDYIQKLVSRGISLECIDVEQRNPGEKWESYDVVIKFSLAEKEYYKSYHIFSVLNANKASRWYHLSWLGLTDH